MDEGCGERKGKAESISEQLIKSNMKKLLLNVILLTITISAFAQNNPYDIFGYKPKVVYKESRLDRLRVPADDPDKLVKFLEFDFQEKVINLIGRNDSILQKIVITQDKLLRWSTVDPLAEKYMPYSPYAYVGNNPVNRIDPNGKEWEDPKDKKKAAQIDAQLKRTESQLQKRESNLTSRIAKALDKGNMDKVASLAEKRNAAADARGQISTSRSEIAAMGADKTKMFAFNELPVGSSQGYLSTSATGTTVINYISGAAANTVHELAHAGQVQQGLTRGIPGSSSFYFLNGHTPIAGETTAYRRQFAFDPASLPPSSFTPTPTTLQGIGGNYINGIYSTDKNGVKSWPYLEGLGN